MIVVVLLDDRRFGSGPATVVEVSDDPLDEILARHTDRDGARDDRLRFWSATTTLREGDRVEAAQLVPGTGRWDGAP